MTPSSSSSIGLASDSDGNGLLLMKLGRLFLEACEKLLEAGVGPLMGVSTPLIKEGRPLLELGEKLLEVAIPASGGGERSTNGGGWASDRGQCTPATCTVRVGNPPPTLKPAWGPQICGMHSLKTR